MTRTRVRAVALVAGAGLASVAGIARASAEPCACDATPAPGGFSASRRSAPSIRTAVAAPVPPRKKGPVRAPARRKPVRKPVRPPAPSREVYLRGVRIGTTAVSATGDVRLTLVSRLQHYDPKPRDPGDRHDPDVFSPKSVRF